MILLKQHLLPLKITLNTLFISLFSGELKHWNLRRKKALCRDLTSPKIPFSLWRWTVMSGFIKLLASIGIPIPRLANWIFVKDGNNYICNVMEIRHWDEEMMQYHTLTDYVIGTTPDTAKPPFQLPWTFSWTHNRHAVWISSKQLLCEQCSNRHKF